MKIKMDSSELLNRISFKCGVCEEPHDDETDLLLHIRKEHRADTNLQALHIFRYVCPKCDNSYRRTEDLLVHINKVHLQRKLTREKILVSATLDEPYVCGICPKTFRTVNQLTIHRRLHVNSKKFKCKSCNRAFEDKPKLDTHVCIHKPYPCDVCHRKFETLNEAERHCAAPFMEKPFLCQVCGKKFRLYKQLWLHTKKHKENNKIKES